jgi:tetratricopeptide (TPR) repeat protein
MPLKPLVFVAMPFGKKRAGKTKIDFDDIYNRAIKPAALACDVEIIRADEELSGGFIHLSMYERLLLAEIVIADLTTANPNVFYELGIRHCARPRSTILIVSSQTKLPFDVAPLRALPYKLNKGVLSDRDAIALKEDLEKKIADAKKDTCEPDSPLFQIVDKFPGIDLPHESTETFRDRTQQISAIRIKLEQARINPSGKTALSGIKEIERSIGDFSVAPQQLLIDLLLSYRDAASEKFKEPYDDMIRIVELFPSSIREIVTVQEQLAFALNRRNKGDDRDRAIRILEKLIKEHGQSPETYGILGRIYKDLYKEAKGEGNIGKARAALDEAIAYYTKGFMEDPRDYYPGVNALTLLFEKGGIEADADIRKLYPFLKFAVGRRGGLASNDYWDIATVLEVSVLERDWIIAGAAADKLILKGKATWNFETTINNLKLIREKFKENGDIKAAEHLNLLLKKMDAR